MNGCVSWLVLLYFFLLDTEILVAFCHWIMQLCRCTACVCARARQCLHGYKHMIMWVSVSPWLQAYELCYFGGLLAPSPNRHLTMTLPKLKCLFLELPEYRFSVYFLSKYFLYFWLFELPFSCHSISLLAYNDPFLPWFRYQAHYSLLLFPN